MNKERLLLVAKATRETKDPGKFNMSLFGYSACGTPGCVIGNYAAREDLQGVFRLSSKGVLEWKHVEQGVRAAFVEMSSDEFLDHFGIGFVEMEELFETMGCDGAQTHTEAADYIEWFVWKEGQ